MTNLSPNPAVRMETARGDFVKGTVRPDAPGMVYYPSIAELAITYDLIESVIAKTAREDQWLDARVKAMSTSLVTPFSAAVDADPNVIKRSDRVARDMETFDDRVFSLNQRILRVAELAVEKLEAEAEEDPMRAIRGIKSVSQVVETIHRTNKTAYDPASIRPENTVNILSLNQIQASEEVVGKVAKILAQVKQDAIASGIAEHEIEEAEIVEQEE